MSNIVPGTELAQGVHVYNSLREKRKRVKEEGEKEESSPLELKPNGISLTICLSPALSYVLHLAVLLSSVFKSLYNRTHEQTD